MEDYTTPEIVTELLIRAEQTNGMEFVSDFDLLCLRRLLQTVLVKDIPQFLDGKATFGKTYPLVILRNVKCGQPVTCEALLALLDAGYIEIVVFPRV